MSNGRIDRKDLARMSLTVLFGIGLSEIVKYYTPDNVQVWVALVFIIGIVLLWGY